MPNTGFIDAQMFALITLINRFYEHAHWRYASTDKHTCGRDEQGRWWNNPRRNKRSFTK